MEQKLDLVYKVESYRFAKYCLEHLSGKYQGQLITDCDYRGIHPYLIMYYLYPVVELRKEGGGHKECLIIFNKNNPLAIVPYDYDILGTYNSKSLLAVKRN